MSLASLPTFQGEGVRLATPTASLRQSVLHQYPVTIRRSRVFSPGQKDLLRASMKAKLKKGRDQEVELLLKQDKGIKRRLKIQRDEDRRTNFSNMQRNHNVKEEESQSKAGQFQKDLLRALMKAKAKGRDQEVELLSKQDKGTKRRIKIQNDEDRRTNFRNMQRNRNVKEQESQSKAGQFQKDLLRALMKAKAKGRDQEVELLSKQDKGTKRRIKIQNDEDRRTNFRNMQRNRNVKEQESQSKAGQFQNPYHPTLPRFGSVFKNKMAGVSAACKPEFQNDSAGLVGETAICEAEQDGKEIKWPYKVQNHFRSTDNRDNDSYMTEGTPGIQDIPTWKNLFDSLPPSYPTIRCKFGCPVPMLARDDQMIHETHCLLQPIRCPLTMCNWFSQLRSLSTHILKVHIGNLAVGSEASFTINFGIEELNSFYSTGSLDQNRLCYIQLFQERLFAIFVIANFQSMQITIYTQYINDTALWDAKVALSVCKVDGAPYHWSGLVHPLTYSGYLINEPKCLVFDMNSKVFVNNILTLHTKIDVFNLEDNN